MYQILKVSLASYESSAEIEIKTVSIQKYITAKPVYSGHAL